MLSDARSLPTDQLSQCVMNPELIAEIVHALGRERACFHLGALASRVQLLVRIARHPDAPAPGLDTMLHDLQGYAASLGFQKFSSACRQVELSGQSDGPGARTFLVDVGEETLRVIERQTSVLSLAKS